MTNKNIVVVGGSSGIGLAIVKKCVEAGNQVWVLSRTNEALVGLSNVHHLTVDILSDEVPIAGLPDEIDGLVYCPGSITLKGFRSLKAEHFQADFNINVLGAVKTIQALQRPLKKSSFASIVLFSTVAVQMGMPFHASIATAKGAVEGLTKSLAAEFVPKIRVNCIAPSLTDTPLASSLLSTEEKKTAAANRHPLRKVGTPNDLANLAYFLLSEESSWITGQIIGADGGMSTLKV